MKDPAETKIAIVLLLIMVAWVGSSACMATPTPRKQSEKGWLLRQAHFVEKQLYLLVTSHGVRVQAVKEYWGIICTAPNWDAYVFSRSDKTVCRVPYKRWSQEGFPLISVDDASAVMPKSRAQHQGHEDIRPFGEIPVTFLSWNGSTDATEDMFFRLRVRPSQCNYVLETTDSISTPAQVRELLTKFYRVPQTRGFPIGYSSSIQSRPILHTLELRRVDVADDAFAVPVGYRTVKSETDVWLNAKDKAKINDFGELMGH